MKLKERNFFICSLVFLDSMNMNLSLECLVDSDMNKVIDIHPNLDEVIDAIDNLSLEMDRNILLERFANSFLQLRSN